MILPQPNKTKSNHAHIQMNTLYLLFHHASRQNIMCNHVKYDETIHEWLIIKRPEYEGF